jgi:hypothetical protein
VALSVLDSLCIDAMLYKRYIKIYCSSVGKFTVDSGRVVCLLIPLLVIVVIS